MATANVEAVPGIVIGQARKTTWAGLAMLLLIFAVGMVILWAYFTDTPLPLPLLGESLPGWGGVTGAFMTVVSSIFIPVALLSLFVQEKLIIAADRLQVVFNGKVHAQIPFRNIARLALVRETDFDCLGVDLVDPSDPDSFANNWEFERNKIEDGWHFFIFAVYDCELAEIYRLLEGQWAKHRASTNP